MPRSQGAQSENFPADEKTARSLNRQCNIDYIAPHRSHTRLFPTNTRGTHESSSLDFPASRRYISHHGFRGCLEDKKT